MSLLILNPINNQSFVCSVVQIQLLLRVFTDFMIILSWPLFRSVRSASEAAKSGIPLEEFRDGFQVETGLIYSSSWR